MNRKTNRQLRVYKNDCKSRFYKIEDSDTLMNITSKLYGYYTGKSKLFLYNKNYYLELENYLLKENNPVKHKKYLKGILEEYGMLLSKDAVREIGSKIRGS